MQRQKSKTQKIEKSKQDQKVMLPMVTVELFVGWTDRSELSVDRQRSQEYNLKVMANGTCCRSAAQVELSLNLSTLCCLFFVCMLCFQ